MKQKHRFPNRVAVLVMLLIGYTLSVHNAWSQDTGRAFQGMNLSSFATQVILEPLLDRDSVLIHVYNRVSNDILQFVLSDSVYQAECEITLILRDRKARSVENQTRRYTLTAERYAETTSSSIHHLYRTALKAVPGMYTLSITLSDPETSHPIKTEEKLILPDFHDRLFMASDPFFTVSPSDSASGTFFTPVIPPVREPSDTVFACAFYMVCQEIPCTLWVMHSLFDPKGSEVFSDSVHWTARSKKSMYEYPVTRPLDFGQYTLKTRIIGSTHKQDLSAEFYVHWESHPAFLPSLEGSVQTLLYVMDRSEYNRLLALPEEGQREMLEHFWKERDPDPSSPENQLENEYYTRVYFTNQKFSDPTGIEGWRTDRGRIYILYGAPTELESPPTAHERDSRYEIWYYHHLKKKFIFIDKFASGDYRLYSEE